MCEALYDKRIRHILLPQIQPQSVFDSDRIVIQGAHVLFFTIICDVNESIACSEPQWLRGHLAIRPTGACSMDCYTLAGQPIVVRLLAGVFEMTIKFVGVTSPLTRQTYSA